MIVIDASAALSALLNAGPARHAMTNQQLHVPHLVDSEVANALRRVVAAGRLDADRAWNALDRWRYLGMTRYPVFGLVDRVWELRNNLSAYDAAYVALAERLDCALLTADGRLRTCLFSLHETDLRGPMRAGADDAELERIIREAVWRKELKHHVGERGFIQPARSMSAIGG